MMQPKVYEQMDSYEKEIAQILVDKYNYGEDEARSVLVNYYPVMERIGWYETPEEWADSLHVIYKEKGLSPKQWDERINEKFGEFIKPREREFIHRKNPSSPGFISVSVTAAKDAVKRMPPRRKRLKRKIGRTLIRSGSSIRHKK